MSSTLNVERAVLERYTQAAHRRTPALCCPVEPDSGFLKVIPAEILERDYGCGDPSRHLHAGETVLDLGSGAGKICYLAAQAVGPRGRVIGVDMNDDMLALARRHQRAVGDALGYHNVEFRKGRIQDLALDLELLDAELKRRPITGAHAFLAAEQLAEELRRTRPLVPAESIDVVVSSCVLNLVDPSARRQLFAGIFRVLKSGGRAVISDIVSDEPVPAALQADPQLWSGCISGAMTEEGFLDAFVEAGCYGAHILRRDAAPWRTVEGIEFRSMTIEAFKGKEDLRRERHQAVLYKGPFREVTDDDGHRFLRGRRHAVCDQTFQRLRQAPYADHFELIEPRAEVQSAAAGPLERAPGALHHPRDTKGQDDTATATSASCCGSGSCD